MSLRRFALVFALPTLLLGAGCGEGAKVNECNMVVDTVASGREQLEAMLRQALGAQQASTEAPSGLRRTSEVYAELAGALGQLPLNDGELKGAVSEFRQTLEGLARRGREAADAWSTGDSKGAADALAHFDRDELSVDERVRSVNHVCQR
jgi:outer membrane murein-binding lipoprotein Lpp